MNTYEGMFLLDAGQANFDEAVKPIQDVMDRNQAELVQMRKWDERRLAYEIKGRRRGLYVLTYFKADPTAIRSIERDVQLNEGILRVLILSAGHVSADKMNAPTPAEAEKIARDTEEADKTKAEAKTEGEGEGEAKAEEAPVADEAVADAPAPAEEAKPAE